MVPIQEEISNVAETKEKILELLLGDSKSAGEVAVNLRIQKSAARVHLESLQSLGAVRSKLKSLLDIKLSTIRRTLPRVLSLIFEGNGCITWRY
jgi:hypothetical protein